MERGFQVSGLILVHPETHERILIEASAVVTLENEKMWELFHPSETTITDEQIAHIEKTHCCPRAFCQPREGQAFPMEIPLVTETELYYHCKRCETVWVVQKRKLITHLYEPHPE